MAAGSIIIDLLMRTGSFETDTARAQRSLKKLKAEADDLGRKIGLAFTATATALGFVVSRTLAADDRLQKLAQSSGIAADTLGGIGHAADLAGVDLETAASAVTKLNKAIAGAAAGDNDALEAFTALGVAVKDAAGNTRAADAVLTDLADKFASYADGPEKAAIALKLFGKTGAELIPLLDGGGQALAEQIAYWKQYSGFSAEAAAQSEVFNDTMTRIALLMGSFGRALTAEVLPTIQNLADLFLEAREKGDGFGEAAKRIADGFRAIVVAGAAVATTFVTFGDQIGAFFARAKAFLSLDFAGAAAIGAEASANLDAARKGFTAFYDAIYNGRTKADSAPDPVAPKKGNAPRLPGSNAGSSAKAARAFTGPNYDEQIAQKAGQLLEESDVTRAKVYADTLAKLDELYLQGGIDAALYESALKKLTGATDTSEAAAKAFADMMAEGRRVFSETRTPAEELASTQSRLNDLLAAGAIDWDTYSRAVFKAQDAFDAATKNAEKASTALDDFAKNAAENIQRSFGDALVNAMDGNWKSIGDGFTSMLNRIVAEAAAAQITRYLFGGDVKGGVTGTGGVAGDLLKQFGQLLGFASGGNPPVNQPSIVGERGPELFIPRTAGTILPANQTAAALSGRSVSVVNHFAVTGPIDRRTEQQIAASAGRSVQVALARGGN